jgi:hypothetical protein
MTFATRHARLPESYDELTEGYVRNHAFSLGYIIGGNGAGSYRIGVRPQKHWWAEVYVDEDGWEHWQIHPYEVDEFGHRVGPQNQICPPATEENKEGFIWILTHEDFMD